MPKSDVTYNTIGFTGNCAESGSTFTLYLDDEKTGAKTYHVYFKQLGGGNITLTTGKTGATDLVLNSGTYVAIIYVDENGNITTAGTTNSNSVTLNNMQSVTSNAVAQTLETIGLKVGTFGVLGGANVASGSLADLWTTLCGGQGKGGICGGSCSGFGDGWRTFIYIPHRTGINGDNPRYGTLITFPMVNQNTSIYVYRNNGSGFSLIKTL
jgi:hypothetical protein